ncbi:MAG TPA: TRAP transporter substrate-binding protein DctP [Candidatus Methylomirabilis sp.]|nr:TRAP transporter substrate-binding protein DctP [Candidatus Methylomirabilis sp.]
MNRGAVVAVLVVMLGSLLVLGVLAPVPPADAQATMHKWRMNQTHPADSPFGKAAEAFAAEVKQRTNGRVDITVYHAGALGDWVLSDELVMRGSVELNLGPVAPTYDPRLNIAYYTPYLFKTVKEGKAAYAKGGWINRMVDDLFAGVNIKGLSVLPLGMSGATMRKVPPSPGDPDVPKGQKIRVMPLKVCELTFKRLGYIPVSIPYAEAYSAIETGIADGEMGGPPFQGHEFADVQGAWVQYNDFVETHWFKINRKLFDSLSKEDQNIMIEAAERQGEKQWQLVEAQDEEYRKKMADKGLKIILLSDAELEKIATAIRTDVWPELDNIVGKALMDLARKQVGMPVK